MFQSVWKYRRYLTELALMVIVVGGGTLSVAVVAGVFVAFLWGMASLALIGLCESAPAARARCAAARQQTHEVLRAPMSR